MKDAAWTREEHKGKDGDSKQHYGSGVVVSSMSCPSVGRRGVPSGLQPKEVASRM